MGIRLKDRVAVVTGAGRGIGRAIAIGLAQEGAKVVVNDLGCTTDGRETDTGPAGQVANEIKALGGDAIASYDSVAAMAGGERIINSAVDNFGKIDILVNVAGIDRGRMVFNMTEEEWDDVIAVHMKGTFVCTKFASQLMRKQRSGRIINCTSAAGLTGEPGHSNYCAAKAGIAGFTRAVARELGRYGITVNAFMPAAATRMADLVTEEIRKKREEMGTGLLPGITWPLPPPEDLAPAVVYLATDEAANINGQIIGVIGGRVFLYSHPTEIKTIYKEGRWTVDELVKLIPSSLALGLENPAPPTPKT